MKKQLTFCLTLLTILCTSTHAQLPSYLPADGLVAWYPFNGNANDESGNGNDLIVNGALLHEDRFNQGLKSFLFSNQNSLYPVNTSQAINYASSNSFTYVFWVKSELPTLVAEEGTINNGYGAITGSQCVIHPIHGQCFGPANLHSGVGVYVGINGVEVIEHSDNFIRVSLSYTSQISNWNQVIIIYDNKVPSLYINGVFIKTGISFNDRTPHLSLGAIDCFTGYNISGIGAGFAPNNTFGQYFQGSIDDIAIYNRALTEQEIQNLYTGTNTTTDTGDGSAPLPQGIPYQAAARDGNGQPVVNSPVTVRFSLHEGAADGTTSYIESHSLTTNSIGLFNTVFGNGTPEQSAFDSINWAATTKFLQVEVDLGNGYVDMGTTQLLSVPYAFRSAQAANIKNAALPVYSDNAAALAGGLVAGEMYRTPAGVLMIAY